MIPARARAVLFALSVTTGLSCVLPDDEAAILQLNVDFAGTLNLSEGTLKVDASLRESKVAGFALTGDMAVRAAFIDQPSFLISFGGFHPEFSWNQNTIHRWLKPSRPFSAVAKCGSRARRITPRASFIMSDWRGTPNFSVKGVWMAPMARKVWDTGVGNSAGGAICPLFGQKEGDS